MATTEQAIQQSAERAQYNVNNDTLVPVLRGPDFVNSWGSVASVEVQGPLKDLEKNEYEPNLMTFPKDLGSMSKGHTIQFDIRDVDPAKINLSNIGTAAGELGTDLKNIGSEVAADYTLAPSSVSKVGLSIEKFYADSGLKSSIGSTVEKLTDNPLQGNGQWNFNAPLTKDVIDSIRLYMPDTMNFSYNAQYDKLNLAEAINSVPLVAKVSNAVTGILNNNMVKLASQKIGYVFNPQQQMLFEGIDFREFELEFTFTPTSPGETKNINSIIKRLRRAAAPTIQNAAGGFFFTPPSVFNIHFLYNGQVNTNIQQTRPCVLQSITVNYAPNGWSALNDGAPVQTVVSLSFKEIELVDRASIEQEHKSV